MRAFGNEFYSAAKTDFRVYFSVYIALFMGANKEKEKCHGFKQKISFLC